MEVALGDHEAAFRGLAEAERQHTNFMVLLKIDPWLVPLHSDPRFQQLLSTPPAFNPTKINTNQEINHG